MMQNSLKKLFSLLLQPRWRVCCVSVTFFLMLALYACHGGVWWPEKVVLSLLKQSQTTQTKEWMHIISNMGRGRFLFPLAACPLLLLLLKKDWKAAVFLVTCDGISLLNPFFKLMFHRARPELSDGHVAEWNFGFPSGHATLSSALVFGMLLIALKYYREGRMKLWILAPGIAFGIMFVFMVGWTRLYLLAHYPSDVFGGWASSLAWVSCMYGWIFGNDTSGQGPSIPKAGNWKYKAGVSRRQKISPLKVSL